MPIIGLFYSTDKTSINAMKPTLDKIESIAKEELNGKKEGLIIAADMDTLKLILGDEK